MPWKKENNFAISQQPGRHFDIRWAVQRTRKVVISSNKYNNMQWMQFARWDDVTCCARSGHDRTPRSDALECRDKFTVADLSMINWYNKQKIWIPIRHFVLCTACCERIWNRNEARLKAYSDSVRRRTSSHNFPTATWYDVVLVRSLNAPVGPHPDCRTFFPLLRFFLLFLLRCPNGDGHSAGRTEVLGVGLLHTREVSVERQLPIKGNICVLAYILFATNKRFARLL